MYANVSPGNITGRELNDICYSSMSPLIQENSLGYMLSVLSLMKRNLGDRGDSFSLSKLNTFDPS